MMKHDEMEEEEQDEEQCQDQQHVTMTTAMMVREEQVISLFWAKVISLLYASATVLLSNVVAPNPTSATSRSRSSSQLSNTHKELLQPTPQLSTSFLVLHAACASPSPISIVRICLQLYPGQLQQRHAITGRFPLHEACSRRWFWGTSSFVGVDAAGTNGSINSSGLFVPDPSVETEDNTKQWWATNHIEWSDDGEDTFRDYAINLDPYSQASLLLQDETSKVLHLVLSHSNPEASRTHDSQRRLPLHIAIETVRQVLSLSSLCDTNEEDHDEYKYDYYYVECRRFERILGAGDEICFLLNPHQLFLSLLNYLRPLVQSFPEALERRDGVLGLVPFMQMAVGGTSMIPPPVPTATWRSGNTSENDSASTSTRSRDYHYIEEQHSRIHISLIYILLREHSSLVQWGIPYL